MKPDGIWGGGASYPGKPSCPIVAGCQRRQQNRLDEEISKRGGAEGGRFTDSTNDSGPRKRWQQRGGENPEDQTEGNEHIGKKSQYAAVWLS